MFNIGPLEILTVLVIALVVVGPKRLPELARTIGRGLNEFRKIQDEVKDMVKFDLGADLLGEDDEPTPSYELAHPEHEAEMEPGSEPDAEEEGSFDDGSTDDGMTHSERVIATLPDDEQEVTPLPAVTSTTGAAPDEEPSVHGHDPAEPASDEPPAAAAE